MLLSIAACPDSFHSLYQDYFQAGHFQTSHFAKFSKVSWHESLTDHKFQLLISSKMPKNTDTFVTSNLIALASKCKKILSSLGEICSQYACL